METKCAEHRIVLHYEREVGLSKRAVVRLHVGFCTPFVFRSDCLHDAFARMDLSVSIHLDPMVSDAWPSVVLVDAPFVLGLHKAVIAPITKPSLPR